MNKSEHLTPIEMTIANSNPAMPQPVRDRLLYSTGYQSGKALMKRWILLSSIGSCLLTSIAIQAINLPYREPSPQDMFVNSARPSGTTKSEPLTLSPPAQTEDINPTPNHFAITPRSRLWLDTYRSENDPPHDLNTNLQDNILTPRNLIGL